MEKINIQITNWEEVARLRDEINKLEADLKKLDVQQNPAIAKEMIANIDKAKSKMKELISDNDFVIAKTTALNQSLSNLAKDLPNAFNGTSGFFSVLKTHLPEIVGQIVALRAANERLAAQGKDTIPIWKALGSGIFAWKTLLTAALSIVITYGPKITDWIMSLGKANDPLAKVADMQNNINERFADSSSSMARQVFTLKDLQKGWNALGGDVKKQEQFIHDNKEAFDSLGTSITSVSDAEKLLVEKTPEFIKALELRYKAAAAKELAIEKFREGLVKGKEVEKEKKEKPTFWDHMLSATARSGLTHNSWGSLDPELYEKMSPGAFKEERDAKNEQEAKDKMTEAEEYSKMSANLQVESNSLFKLFTNNDDKENDGNQDALQRQKQIADELFRLKEENTQKKVEQIENEGEKVREQIELNYKKQIDLIEQKEKEWSNSQKNKKLTPEQQEAVTTAKELAENERKIALDKVVADEKNAEKEKENIRKQQQQEEAKVLKAKLAEHQSYIDKRKEIEEKYEKYMSELREARTKAEKEGNTGLVSQIDRSMGQATRDKGTELVQLDVRELKKNPEYIQAFENLKVTSTETLNSLLIQFETAKQEAEKTLSPDQLAEYTQAIQGIMSELESRNPFKTLAVAQSQLANAQMNLAKAKGKLDGVRSGEHTTEAEQQAMMEYMEALNKVASASAKVKKAQGDVNEQIGKLANAIKSVGQSMGGLAGDILSMIGDIATTIMFAIEGLSTTSSVASQSIQAVEKASVILAIIGAAFQIISKISSFFGADTEEYEKAKKVYEDYISIIGDVIDKQKELLNTLTGENARNSYEYAKSLIKESELLARELGRNYLNSGASSGIKSSPSKGVSQRKGISDKAWNQAKNVLGDDFYKFEIGSGRMTGLFNLTIDQLIELRDMAGLFWAELHEDTRKYLNDIIATQKQAQEVEEARLLTHTGIDFESLKSSLDDLIVQADLTFKDIQKSFEEHMSDAILN